MMSEDYEKLRDAADVQRKVLDARAPATTTAWEKVLPSSDRSPSFFLRAFTARHRIDGFGRDLGKDELAALTKAKDIAVRTHD